MYRRHFHTFILIFCLAEVCFGYKEYSNCGADGGNCRIECTFDRIMSNCYSTFGGYSSRYDSCIRSSDPDPTPCVLESLNYNNVAQSETEIDLSGRSLTLHHLPNKLQGVKTDQIKTLNVSRNNFYVYGLHRYKIRDSWEDLHKFVSQFTNLTTLDLSGTISKGMKATKSLETYWSKTLALKHLDASNNSASGKISKEAFKNMVNLEYLNLADCCEQLPKDTDFFKDLNNVKFLNIAGNRWRHPSKTALFSMKKLEYLDMSRTNALFDPTVFFVKLRNLEVVLLNNFDADTLNVSDFDFGSNRLWRLSLSGNKLTGFEDSRNPFGLQNSSNLKFLDLSNANIIRQNGHSVIPFFQKLTGLKFLNASGSLHLIEEFNSSLLQNCTRLEQLDLRNLELSESASGNDTNFFRSLQNLEKLFMTNVEIFGERNNQKNESKLRSKMQSLKFLTLKEATCRNCSFWPLIGECRNLSEIDLSFSTGFDLSSTLLETNLPKLERLNISRGSFSTVSLLGLPELKVLDVSGVQANMLKLSGLPKLEFLNLSSNEGPWDSQSKNFGRTKIDTLDLSNLPNLKWIDFSQSNVNRVFLSNLPKIEKVNLFNSKFASFYALQSVKLVNVSNSEIEELLLENLPALDELDLSKSTLQKIKISNASNLTSLDMSFITLKELIKQVNISQFPKLSNLNLSHCELLEIPDTFTNFEFLRSLDLSHNFLDYLPNKLLPPIGKCKLVNLDLSHNYFEVIRAEVIKPMISPYTCWKIDLQDNPLNCSDCYNSWMTSKEASENIKNALCQLPFEKYHMKVQDAEICRENKND